MELSPKQQAVNEIKNAKHLLILGHKSPDGDQLGSLLALKEALAKIQKTVTVIVTEEIPETYNFLPSVKEIKKEYRYTDGKILRIDTKRIPVEGMKWRRDEQFLDIHLETEKNLKFEFIEIINGLPKPDLIIVVDTPHLIEIEKIYQENEKLFLETPVLNIDHHPGNEYYGTVNLVDLTATSTAEILVSLFEALGIKIDTPDLATSLLTGILADTESFRSQNTTPKSLTVAAQLLAAGGRQQEIVRNLFEKKPDDLLKLLETLVQNLEQDVTHKVLWSRIDGKDSSNEDLGEAAGALLEQNPDYNLALIFAPDHSGQSTKVIARGEDKNLLQNIARAFNTEVNDGELFIIVNESNISDAQKIVLKKIAENFSDQSQTQLWDVIEKKEEISKDEAIRAHRPLTVAPPNSIKEKEDAIEEALKSISQAEKDENRKEMESLREVIDRKRANGAGEADKKSDDADIFGDE